MIQNKQLCLALRGKPNRSMLYLSAIRCFTLYLRAYLTSDYDVKIADEIGSSATA